MLQQPAMLSCKGNRRCCRVSLRALLVGCEGRLVLVDCSDHALQNFSDDDEVCFCHSAVKEDGWYVYDLMARRGFVTAWLRDWSV